ncbi:MAG: hypothetical protein HC901_04565 [Bdellovibrionaceae bacterium]|nr:hypothetical protein [Pseudobdellovibrionaceae bacterium]
MVIVFTEGVGELGAGDQGEGLGEPEAVFGEGLEVDGGLGAVAEPAAAGGGAGEVFEAVVIAEVALGGEAEDPLGAVVEELVVLGPFEEGAEVVAVEVDGAGAGGEEGGEDVEDGVVEVFVGPSRGRVRTVVSSRRQVDLLAMRCRWMSRLSMRRGLAAEAWRGFCSNWALVREPGSSESERAQE